MPGAKELTEDEEAVLDGIDLGGLNLDDALTSADDLQPVTRAKDDAPAMTDPKWQDYVMRQFTEDELAQGNPKLNGLQRVGEQLLGPLIRSVSHVVQSPTVVPNATVGTGLLQPAVVEHTLVILMQRDNTPYHAEFTQPADVYFGNTDPEFARFPTATAASRAEARAWRKALKLKAPAAEELTSLPAVDAAVNGLIQPEQVNFINVLSERCNINVMKFINAGKSQFKSIYDVPFLKAGEMVECLSNFQSNPALVPAGLKGYEANWKETCK